MTTVDFSSKDLVQIRRKGLHPDDVIKQIERFEKGVPFVKVVRAGTASDGVRRVDMEQAKALREKFEEARLSGRVTKFVPASGAASRMFKDLHKAIQTLKSGQPVVDPAVLDFVDHLESFAFYEILEAVMSKQNLSAVACRQKGDYLPILTTLLNRDQMNYANLPKANLLFHRYDNGPRTAAEEHFVEAANYCADEAGTAHLHFTVSPEHKYGFQRLCKELERSYAKAGIKITVGLSVQKETTDTIAVTKENKPFRQKKGELLFRPGGHGALIENLNDLKGDIVFIKNIDNVVPDRLKKDTAFYKQMLGGLLVDLQARVFEYLGKLEDGNTDDAFHLEIFEWFENQFGRLFKAEVKAQKGDEARKTLISLLSRPIRVCGMVQNEGEPGGGPFWVADKFGESVQIVEKAQLDLKDEKQAEIMAQATHFNPVDLVCGLRDRHGKPFDLHEFIDEDTYFVAEKSKDGKTLKALELPGLWNGAMGRWNTVFVEVPLSTFNPVKTINDLLRPNHLSS